MSEPIRYKLGGNCKTLDQWERLGPTKSARLNAEMWAAEHLAASMPTPNGGFIMYWWDGQTRVMKSQYWVEAIQVIETKGGNETETGNNSLSDTGREVSGSAQEAGQEPAVDQ